jgi:hypothetical protein
MPAKLSPAGIKISRSLERSLSIFALSLIVATVVPEIVGGPATLALRLFVG